MTTSTIKQILRSLLGDRVTTWIHAARLAVLNAQRRNPEPDLQFLPAFLRSGDVAIDVGANGADWTSAMARLVGPSGRVYAFEADPYYAEVTAKAIRLLRLRNVVFFPYGLSDRRETAWLQIVDASNQRVSGTGSVVRGGRGDMNPERCVRIALRPLDEVAMSFPDIRKARVLKCDVEGFELMVFLGGRRTIEQARPIVITEVDWTEAHGYEDGKLFDFFRELGYDSYVAVSERRLRRSQHKGGIPEGPRPNRVMIPTEWTLPDTIEVEPS